MRIKGTNIDSNGNINGYTMWLSDGDTYSWAHKEGACWPCSQISGNRIVVNVDSNGISGFAMNGKGYVDVDGTELGAIVSDHLPAKYRHLWPTWELRESLKGREE